MDTMFAMHDHTRTPALAWAAAPCLCCKRHRPQPAQTAGHHAHPQWAQMRAWGTIREHTTVPLCDTGHVAVHAYINAVLAGVPPPRLNPYLRAIAEQGLAFVRDNAIPPPYPPPLVPAAG